MLSLVLGLVGYLAIQAFGTERKAVVTFDPQCVTRDRIRAILEAPIPFDDGSTGQVFRCLAVEPAR